MSKQPEYRFRFNNWDCLLQEAEYAGGRRALVVYADDTTHNLAEGLLPGEPIAKLTIHIPEPAYPLAPHEVVIKNYSENEEIVDFLMAKAVLIPTPGRVMVGQCIVPVCTYDLNPATPSEEN